MKFNICHTDVMQGSFAVLHYNLDNDEWKWLIKHPDHRVPFQYPIQHLISCIITDNDGLSNQILITVGTPYNTNVGVQKIPDRAIWKPVVAKRNNTNPWSCSEPQILVTRDSRQVHMAEQPASPEIGLSKFLPSCIHHRVPDNSLISVNL